MEQMTMGLVAPKKKLLKKREKKLIKKRPPGRDPEKGRYCLDCKHFVVEDHVFPDICIPCIEDTITKTDQSKRRPHFEKMV